MATKNVWLDDTSNDISSNRFIQTYLQGYLDMSGGDLRLRNQNIFVNNGDMSLNGILSVASDTSLNSKLFVANDVSMDTILMVGGDVSMNSHLFVANDVSMDTVLMVGGDVSLNSHLFVANDVSMDTVLTVGGDVSLNSHLFVANDVSMDTVLMVGGDVSLNSKLFVVNDVSMDAVLDVSGDVFLNSHLFVANDVSMDAVLAVGGDGSFNYDLFVNHDVSVNGNLSVGGAFRPKNIATTGYAKVGRTLDVSGRSTFGAEMYVDDVFSTNTVIIKDGMIASSNIIPVYNLPYYATEQNSFIDNELHVYRTDFSGNETALNGKYDISASSTASDLNVDSIFNDDNKNWKWGGETLYNGNDGTYAGTYNTTILNGGDTETISGEYIEIGLPFHIRLTNIYIETNNNSGDSPTVIFIVAKNESGEWVNIYSGNHDTIDVSSNKLDVSSNHIEVSSNQSYANSFRYIFQKSKNDLIVYDLSFSGDVIGSAVHINNSKIGIGIDAPRSKLEIIGDVTISKAPSGINSSGVAREHGRIAWCGQTRDIDNEKATGSYIRSYFEKDTFDTSGNLAFGTSDGSNGAVDRFIIRPSGESHFTGDVSMDTYLSVADDVSLNSKLWVGGDVSMDTVLMVGGDVSLNSHLFVANDVFMDTVLEVSGDVFLKSQLFVANDVSMNAGLTVSEDVSFNSNLNVIGKSQFSTVTTSGDISANSDFRVGKILHVNGDASFNRNVEISGNLVINGAIDVRKFEHIKNTTVENYTIVFSEDMSLNGRLDVSGGTNINDRFVVDAVNGRVNVIDQNITIGKEIYLDKLISEAVFTQSNVDAVSIDSNGASDENVLNNPVTVSFSNAKYTVHSSTINGKSTENTARRAFNRDGNSWKSATGKYNNGSYNSTGETQYIDTNSTINTISGEWIQITFPYETILDSFQLHTSDYQLPQHGMLLADTGNGTDASWTLLAEYNKDDTPVLPNYIVDTTISNEIITRRVRLVIDKISTSNTSTSNYYENNVAIEFLNFSGTYKDTGILYGSGNSQSAGNTGIGFSTLSGNLSGKNNIAIGSYALAQSTDSDNVGVGYNSLELNSSGGKNIGIGTDALSDNVTGFGNTAIGYFSGINNVDGSFNSFIGYNSGTNGKYSHSTALGQNARITDNHQIVLGTKDDTLSIPGDVSYISVINMNVANAIIDNLDVSGDATIKSGTTTVSIDSTGTTMSGLLTVNNGQGIFNKGLTSNGTTTLGQTNITGAVSVEKTITANDISVNGINSNTFNSTRSNTITSIDDNPLTLSKIGSIIDFKKITENTSDINIKASNIFHLLADQIQIGVGTVANAIVIDSDGKITLNPNNVGVTIEGTLITNGDIRASGDVNGNKINSVVAASSTITQTSDIVNIDISAGGPVFYPNGTVGNSTYLLELGQMKINGDGFDPTVGKSIFTANLGTVNYGDVSFNYNVDIKKLLTSNALIVDASSVLHDIEVTNDTSLNNLEVSGTSTFNSTLDVSGTTTLKSLTASNNVTFGANLDVNGTTTLKSSLDVSGTLLFQNGTFEINDNSFNLTNIPISITGNFSNNTKVVYSQYTGSDRVFNGAYDISASSNSVDAWNAVTDTGYWESPDTYLNNSYVGSATDISHVTDYYTDDVDSLVTISGEYIELKYPFSMKVTDICFGAIVDGTNTIGECKLVGDVNAKWKHILDVTIDNSRSATVSDISYAFTNNLRLVVTKTRDIGSVSAASVKISNLSFSGDVTGSKTHISEGNVGIGTTTPRSALDVDGDIILSKPHSGLNETGSSIEHGRISWLGRQRDASNNTSSYIRSYYDNDTWDTCGNLAFGTSDGSNTAIDHIILYSDGITSFIGDMSLNSNLSVGGGLTMNSDILVNAITVGRGGGDISTNTVFGIGALYSNTTGSNNVANGHQALHDNSRGSYNVANGNGALHSNTTGNSNIATGTGALFYNTTGYGNVATGRNAINNNTTGNNNVANGSNALYSNTIGGSNVANGYAALNKNTTGFDNTANGSNALYHNTTGSNNVANGYAALWKNTTGNSNIANGSGTLQNNTTGNYNTANGSEALYKNETGSFNVANGLSALYTNTTGSYNVATGLSALYTNTTGNHNTATGTGALYFNTTGLTNTATGSNSLHYNTTGSNNVATGYQALTSNTTGNYNTATGYNALFSNKTGSNNVANGYEALYTNTTGGFNTATGYEALKMNETGEKNTANGYQALLNNTTGFNNVANGWQALYTNTTGNSNIATGTGALYNNTTGYGNVATGRNAINNNSTGYENTANGHWALASNETGNNNTANGSNALYHNTTGDNNVANGRGALRHNTSGSQNVANGMMALSSWNVGNNNVANGYNSLYFNTSGSYNVANGWKALNHNTTASYNVATGANALYTNTTGSNNVANGFQALHDNTTGSYNVATGFNALYYNQTGSYNSAAGANALQKNTTGSYNVANGYYALFSNTTGSNNTANGNGALHSNTTGSNNVAYGTNALYSNQTGSGNTANGTGALWDNQTGDGNTANGFDALNRNKGSYNVANGYQALFYNTYGSNNVATGYRSLVNNTTGSYNIATGYKSLEANQTGSKNVANGHQALMSNKTGSFNVANGHLALVSNTTGSYNIATGNNALYSNQTASNNIAIGSGTLQNNTTGGSNTAIGNGALSGNLSGNWNTAIGEATLYNNTTGQQSVAIGFQALYKNKTGSYNTANGIYALFWNTTGSNNVATGWQTLYNNTTGSNNVATGYRSLVSNTTGSYNTAIGHSAGDSVNGNYNTFLGVYTNSNSSSHYYSTAIGYGATITASSQIVLGRTGNSTVRIYGATTATSYSTSSDYRIKENVVPISDTSYNIDNLRPVTYTNTKTEKQDFGVIAHEIQEQIPFLVTGEKDGEDHQAVNYNGLIGLLLNEVQQLKKRVQELEQSKP